MGRRAGGRDRRAQARGTVEALVRAGWSAGEVQQVLDLARADGRDPGEVAVRLLVAELRRSLCDPPGEDDPGGGCGPQCEVCAAWGAEDDEGCGPHCEVCRTWGPREADGWTQEC